VPERDALVLAVHRPAEIAPYLRESLFAGEANRRAFQALSGATSLHAAIDAADPDTADLLRELANSEPAGDLDGAVVALVRTAAERVVAGLDGAARAADREGDVERVRRIGRRVDEAQAALEELRAKDEAAGAEDAEPLLAWLSRRDEEDS
jgi:hypothetical protein